MEEDDGERIFALHGAVLHEPGMGSRKADEALQDARRQGLDGH